MSNIELFKGNPLVKGDLFKSLMEINKRMAGGAGGGNRISIRGGRFRMVVGGEEVSVRKEPTLNVMIVNASPVQRTYYKGAYDPKVQSPPTCWSPDSKKPAPEVPDGQRQAPTCDGCKMNIKGSGQGDSRACRFSQRLAVMLEGDTENVYALQVPAASIFGAASGSNMGLQAYVKFLSAHDTPVQAVLAEISFDTASESPKLFFKAVRALEEDELNAVVAAMDSPETVNAITLTVNVEEDTKVKDFAIEDDEDDEEEEEAPPPPKKKAAEKRKVVEVVEEDDEDEEEEEAPPPPKKKAAKAAPAPTASTGGDKLSALLDEWDDEDE